MLQLFLNSIVVMSTQAHQTMCTEWQTWVLNRGRDRARPHAALHDGQQDYDGGGEFDDPPVHSGIKDRLPANFIKLRETQRAALDTIMMAHAKRQQQSRTNSVFVKIRGWGGVRIFK